MSYYIGVDLGGTNINTGVVDKDYNILGRGYVKTLLPKTPEEIAALIEESIDLATKDSNIKREEIAWVGIGMPGIIDSKNGIIDFASNFDFNNVNIAKILGDRINLPVYLENDANAAIYGEMLDGAAKGCKNVVMLTLGTGVGGGVIIDGKIYSGFNSQGAELGHVGIVYDGIPCLCGNKGCIENYCSATALIQQAKTAMEENKDSLLWEKVNGDINKINGKLVFDCAYDGDKTAETVVNQYMDYISFAVVNYINIFQPENIIIGGGIGKEDKLLIPYVREYAEKYALGYTKKSHTHIEGAKLGDDAGIVGAAFLGRIID